MAGSFSPYINVVVAKFIVIESIDAAGGSTQTQLLAKRVVSKKHTPYTLHYPRADAPTGQLIYDKFLLLKNKFPFSRREQALLYIQDFFADADNLRQLLEKKGKHVVISDRYCTSTMAYQTVGLTGAARKKMLDWLVWLCWKGKPSLPKPDKVILLDLPVAIGMKRLNTREDKHKKDFFENKKKQEAIRKSYLALASQQKWTVINCASEDGKSQRTREDIHEDVWQAVQGLIA